jgi:hypothetical protein
MDLLAKKTGFVKRESPITASIFLDILLYSASQSKHFSLREHCIEIGKKHNLNITKQAIDQRYTAEAVVFIESVFKNLLSSQIGRNMSPAFLNKFSSIFINDSTKFDLPESLKENFKGFGGKYTSESGVSIQYLFELKSLVMKGISITSAVDSDQAHSKMCFDVMPKNSLCLKDLGYFKISLFREIEQLECFFLSRLKPKVKVLTPSGTFMSFKEEYEKMKSAGISLAEHQVLIGEKDKFPVRMTLEIMPESEYQKRMAKITKTNKDRKQTTSQEYKDRARFNIFITNIDSETVPKEKIYQLYKFRWQIELIFKVWKSVLGIAHVYKMSYERFMCYLYSKMIIILVSDQIINIIEDNINTGREKRLYFSKIKCYKTLIREYELLRDMLSGIISFISDYMQYFEKIFSNNHDLEKRKKRICFTDLVDIFS